MNKLEVIKYLEALKEKVNRHHMEAINEIYTENPNNIKSMIKTEEKLMERKQKINDVINLINIFSQEKK